MPGCQMPTSSEVVGMVFMTSELMPVSSELIDQELIDRPLILSELLHCL